MLLKCELTEIKRSITYQPKMTAILLNVLEDLRSTSRDTCQVGKIIRTVFSYYLAPLKHRYIDKIMNGLVRFRMNITVVSNIKSVYNF